MEVGTTDTAPWALSAYYDRIQFPALGRDGGHDGMAGEVHLASGLRFRAKGLQTVPQDDRVIIASPGGGGRGDPRRRDIAAVARDVRLGFVTPDAARRDYGVAVSADGTVDREATAALRAQAAK
jgi:N-methylhydantoinase B